MSLKISRRSFACGSLAVGLLSVAGPGLAQNYPSKPIRLIVGYGPGGMDSSARLFANALNDVLGQPVVVENRPGATSMIAAEMVATAPADGYTLFYSDSGLLAGPQLQTAPVDPLTSFAPVAGGFVQPLLIVANNDLEANTPQEFIELLTANPGKFTYGTSGIGTTNALGFEMLKGQVGLDVPHVTYRGASAVLTAIIGGEIQIGVTSAVAALPLVRAGEVKAIGVMTSERTPATDDIPPMADAVPGFDIFVSQFVLAPTGTPEPVIETLSAAINSVLADPTIIALSAEQGNLPWPKDSAELAIEMQRLWDQWGGVIQQQDIKLE